MYTSILIYLKFFRRREWDLSEEAESTAELVKSLQKENSELCDKERRRVEDSREKEGDLVETLGKQKEVNDDEVLERFSFRIIDQDINTMINNLHKFLNLICQIDRILLGSSNGNDPVEDDEDDNDDSRPNLEYVSNVPKANNSKSATREIEKGRIAIATLESQDEFIKVSQKESTRYRI